MAISREKKDAVIAQYQDWVNRSQAVLLVEYTGINVKSLDGIRAKVRDSGGELHIVKNTLVRKVFQEAGLEVPAGYLEKSTAITFAFTDPAATAKALAESSKGVEAIKVKGGFLGKEALNVAQVKALAELPPLPVVRAQLLGVLQAPAGKLVRTIAEPARSLASVFRAYADQAQAAA
ncbi:MAG: 50S ribosomal protein L10 [Anaerolineales bacterium]